MTIGEPGKNGVRTSDLTEAQKILDVFFAHGHKELDTARMYAEGTTESVSFQIIAIGIGLRLISYDLASRPVGSQGLECGYKVRSSMLIVGLLTRAQSIS